MGGSGGDRGYGAISGKYRMGRGSYRHAAELQVGKGWRGSERMGEGRSRKGRVTQFLPHTPSSGLFLLLDLHPSHSFPPSPSPSAPLSPFFPPPFSFTYFSLSLFKNRARSTFPMLSLP